MYWEHTKRYILAKSPNMATNNDPNYVFKPSNLPSNNFQSKCNELWRNKVSMMTIMVQTITAMGLREADSHFLRPAEESSYQKFVEMLHSSVVASKKKVVCLFCISKACRAIFRGCAEILILLRNIQLWHQTRHHINFVSWVVVRNLLLCGWLDFLFSSVVSSLRIDK